MRFGSMKRGLLGTAIILAVLLAASTVFAAKLQTFTGIVGDAVCGAKHTMDGDEISCLRTCIRRGSKYDLIVGDKVYVLNLKDASSADLLGKLATEQARATVRGIPNGDSIDVESVTAAK